MHGPDQPYGVKGDVVGPEQYLRLNRCLSAPYIKDARIQQKEQKRLEACLHEGLGEDSVHDISVTGEAVDDAATRVGVEERHWQPQNPV
jgi:hypothetical protein